jgi:hypothetical protein
MPGWVRGDRCQKVVIEVCPPGEAEEPDPGWAVRKPRERVGFRSLDEERVSGFRMDELDEEFEERVFGFSRWRLGYRLEDEPDPTPDDPPGFLP